MIFPDGTTNHFEYSCCGLDWTRDRLNRVTTFSRDALGRTTLVTDPENRRVEFRYNGADQIINLITWVGGQQRVKRFDYTATNGFSRLTRVTTPMGKLTRYDYTFGGGFAWRQDGNGNVTRYQCDVLRRLVSVSDSNGVELAQMDYDALGNVTHVASGGRTNGGEVLVPPLEQELVYDADGNLVFDGIWSYQWDAENRVVAMTMTDVSGIPNAQRKRLEFAYDHLNRRVAKVVWTWNGSAFANPVTNRYVYDGWNLIAILAPDSSLLTSFMWGLDLSGTLDGAGGVGGLLLFQTYSNSCLLTSSFCAYDGNGNITALINAADKSVAARYEYSPYGELLRATGPLGRANPFRWSTKFWDEESGLVYYGYRYYSRSQGRWTGRDPTTDELFLNLYLFCRNSPLDRFDIDGRAHLIQVGGAGALNASLASRVGGAMFGFISGVGASVVNNIERGNRVDWISAAGWGLAAALGGAITGGIMPGPGLANIYSITDAVFINAYVGSMVGVVGGSIVTGLQHTRDSISDEQYRRMKSELQNAVGGTLTAGDVTFAAWLFDE